MERREPVGGPPLVGTSLMALHRLLIFTFHRRPYQSTPSIPFYNYSPKFAYITVNTSHSTKHASPNLVFP